MRVAIIGGSLTGNKGAASMVLGLLDGLDGHEVAILSPSAPADAASEVAPGIPVAQFGPAEIAVAVLLAPLARLSGGRISTPSLRELSRSDVVADVSGISFVDGRGLLVLVYNVLLVLTPVLLGKPVVKVSQAMGPFQRPTTRVAGRLVLPRMRAVLARGSRTVEHLDDLGIDHAGLVADSAFLMRTSAADREWAADVLAQHDMHSPPMIVVPSQVVVDQAADGGAAYRAAIVALLDDLTTEGPVLVMAHSAQPGQPAGKLNDLPLCRELAERTQRPDRCIVVGDDASPRQLRALMAASEAVVASRFHAMVSALATGTPVLVIGWSHKYQEVLHEFGCSELALDHRTITIEPLILATSRLRARADDLRGQLADRLPPVRQSAEQNIHAIEAAAPPGQGPRTGIA